MKKQILILGKALNKAEQKEVNGGSRLLECGGGTECQRGYECGRFGNCVKITNYPN